MTLSTIKSIQYSIGAPFIAVRLLYFYLRISLTGITDFASKLAKKVVRINLKE